MHGEHAELISQLRSEIARLTRERDKLRAIAVGQEKLLASASSMLRDQKATIERLVAVSETYMKAMQCP